MKAAGFFLIKAIGFSVVFSIVYFFVFFPIYKAAYASPDTPNPKEQAQRYDAQMKTLADQQATATAQLNRYDALIKRQEDLATRMERMMSQWEKQSGIKK
jgi:hypothetical protein